MAGQFILKTVSPEVVTGNRQPLYIGGTDPLGTDGVIVVGADGIARIGEQPIANSSIVQLKNWIINGQFDVWQRGTSQTNDNYGSDDRWFNWHVTSTKTHSRQSFDIGQTDVPNNPTYFSRTVVVSGNTAGSAVVKYQRIEDVTKLASKTVSVSFWAKSDANRSISIEVQQYFGVGGSTAVNAIGVQKFSLTTSWQRFTKTLSIPSINGKTVASGNWTALFFWFDAGSDWNARTDSLGNQSGTFDIANVCLVEGSVPVECPNEPYAEVERKCKRYFRKYGQGTFCQTHYSNSSLVYIPVVLDEPMRTAPVVGNILPCYLIAISAAGDIDLSTLSWNITYQNLGPNGGRVTLGGITGNSAGKIAISLNHIFELNSEL